MRQAVAAATRVVIQITCETWETARSWLVEGQTMKRTPIRPAALVAVLGLLASQGTALGQPAEISWPDAVAQLAGERAMAETCVAVLKKSGDDAQIVRGQLIYADAKANSDAVIAGLIAALSAGQPPASLSSLQTKLSDSLSGLVEFCGTVAKLVPNTAGQKSIVTDIGKIALEPLLKMLSDGVSALYNNHRADDVLTRKTIQTQLEAAKWPAFYDVKAAQ
jgi:hypothetical protein